MTTQHTPGPWHVGLRQAEQIVYNAAGWAVANATVYHGKEDLAATKANARLIAASPDAVPMAEAILNLTLDESDPAHARVIAMARSFLARATGAA